jgi:FKBP-type peptidyl-prolyl cis-trans isomerases 1
MKKILFFALILFLTAIAMSSCEREDYAEWKLLNEQWWKDNKETLENEGYQTTESGLMYRIEYMGPEGHRHPGNNSWILVDYTGKLIDGSTFDSAENATLNMRGLIRGWVEGLKKIRDGGIIHLYVPYSLGYGTDGGGGAIPPYSTLYFKIDLHYSEN